jgi:hypothetical protein
MDGHFQARDLCRTLSVPRQFRNRQTHEIVKGTKPQVTISIRTQTVYHGDLRFGEDQKQSRHEYKTPHANHTAYQEQKSSSFLNETRSGDELAIGS